MPLGELLDSIAVLPGEEENALECLLSAIASHPITKQSSFLFREERAIREILSAFPNAQDSASPTRLLDTELVTALQHASRKILPALSPFQLHATVQQSLIWGENTISEKNDSSTTFTLVCLVLCCRALMQCPENIAKRRERWRSLLWETMHLFQLNLDKPCRIQGGQSTLLFLHLWISYLLPALARVHDALAFGDEESDLREGRFQAAWVAATVATTSQLMNQLTRHTYRNQGTDQSVVEISEKLLHSVQEHAILRSAIPLDALLCSHPWRSNVSQMKVFSSKEPSFEALLAAYTAPNSANNDDDDNSNEKDTIAIVREELCFVDCEWNSTGISLLVSSYWNIKPLVWSWGYQWRLFSPHISPLLLVDQVNVDGSTGEEVHYKDQVQRIGFDLLESLLRVTKTASLEMPSAAYDRPLSPLGLFQLLSNRLVASSLSKKSDLLPSAWQTYQTMKNLLSVHTPQAQYKLIQSLVQTCPHPGMKPKLLDLWRGFISWQDKSAVKSVLSHLEIQYIQRLAREYVDYSHPKQEIANAEELVSSVEMFVAALGLIQIWLKMNGSERHAISRSLMPLLAQIKCSLETTFERWTLDNAVQRLEPPQHSFRLYLLHDAVSLTIELLK